jgi:putative endonuclease
MLARDRAEAGERGERLAAGYLRRIGYDILRRNCRTKLGEVDLIVRDGEEVVFVEVKARSSPAWGEPEDSVHPAKQKRIALAAREFVVRHRLDDHPLRFDVVSILLPPDLAPEFRHYKDAFTLRPPRR